MTLNVFETGLLSVLVFCFIIQLLYLWIVLAKPYYYMRYISKEKVYRFTTHPPVSVIVYTNKSCRDLSEFLPEVLEQEYPEFEVIIVSDGISDYDEEALIRFKNIYSNLYYTSVPGDTRNISRKKLAITLGIKAAKFDKILFTESDCRIRTKHWIYSMTKNFSDKKTIVLGFSAIENAKSLIQKIISLDYLFLNLQMFSFALFNRPYAGNGRNMAYSKEHFIEQKGFAKHRALKQGEDDLFINEIATKINTAVELSADSITLLEAQNFKEWKRQKVDKMTTKRYYKRGPVAFWRLETFFRIVFIIALIACFVSGFPYDKTRSFILSGIALICFIISFCSQLFIVNKTVQYLQLKKFYLTLFLFDIFQPLFNLYFRIHKVFKEKENFTYLYEKR